MPLFLIAANMQSLRYPLFITQRRLPLANKVETCNVRWHTACDPLWIESQWFFIRPKHLWESSRELHRLQHHSLVLLKLFLWLSTCEKAEPILTLYTFREKANLNLVLKADVNDFRWALGTRVAQNQLIWQAIIAVLMLGSECELLYRICTTLPSTTFTDFLSAPSQFSCPMQPWLPKAAMMPCTRHSACGHVPFNFGGQPPFSGNALRMKTWASFSELRCWLLKHWAKKLTRGIAHVESVYRMQHQEWPMMNNVLSMRMQQCGYVRYSSVISGKNHCKRKSDSAIPCGKYNNAESVAPCSFEQARRYHWAGIWARIERTQSSSYSWKECLWYISRQTYHYSKTSKQLQISSV